MRYWQLVVAIVAHIPFLCVANTFTVQTISVRDGVAVITTTQPKLHNLPACVATDTTNHWTINLATESGRAKYSLILIANSEHKDVDLVSHLDCADIEGMERLASVTLKD